MILLEVTDSVEAAEAKSYTHRLSLFKRATVVLFLKSFRQNIPSTEQVYTM